VTSAGPRIAYELLVHLERIDDPSLPIAEINRRLGRFAEARGLTRPSYERVRELIHLVRVLKPRRGPSLVWMMLETSAGVRGAGSLIDNARLPREDRR
jgi:hypothetical protein